jgi:hypothetical protein
MNILIAIGAGIIGLLSLALHITMNQLVKAKLQIEQTPADEQIAQDVDTVELDLTAVNKAKESLHDSTK